MGKEQINPEGRGRGELRKFGFYVALALVATIPGLVMRFTGVRTTPVLDTLIFGVVLLAAGFMLSWSAETAEEHVAQGVAMALLALVTILPEAAVDMYFSFQAGQHPGTDYVQFAAANMTGANRLLIGTAWPLIVILYWWRSGKRAVELRRENSVEIAFLGLGSIYSFVIVLKGQIDLIDTGVLVIIYAAYLWRLGKLPRPESRSTVGDDDDGIEVGPAAELARLPKRQQYTIMTLLAIIAGAAILFIAEPFAESLIETGTALGINRFLLIQWISPLAGEAPEIIITILFVLALRPTSAFGVLVSDKINQWTLLVGAIPLFFSLGAGTLGVLPLDARQHEEFFLTAAQSIFAIALLLRLRLSLGSALVLFGLFAGQLVLGFIYRNDEASTITVLTDMAWLYIGLAVALFLWNRAFLADYVRYGLLNRPAMHRVEGLDADPASAGEGETPKLTAG
jgi:cation:H+ antiporter